MKMLLKYNSIFALFFLFMSSLFGCVNGPGAHRFYSGPPLPEDEIAIVYAIAGCRIRDVRNVIEKETKYLDFMKDAASGMLDLIPGEYVIGITFRHSSDTMGKRTQSLGDKVRIKLDAHSGNVFIIYPEIGAPDSKAYPREDQKRPETWRPVIVNITNYNFKECEIHNPYEDCPNKDRITKKINEYLENDRPIMSFHPLSETPYYIPVTEEAKRNIKGFWW